MYIIEKGKAYLIRGEEAHLVIFENGKSTINEEKSIEVKNQKRYNIDEVYKKLNVAYSLKLADQKQKVKKLNSKEFENYEIQIEELTKKVEELSKENEELRELLNSETEDKEQPEVTNDEVTQEEVNEEK